MNRAVGMACREEAWTPDSALGLPAASELSFSNPMLLFTDVELFLRAIPALLANCVVALIPLYLSLLLIGTAARAYHWTRAMKSARRKLPTR